MYAPAHTIAFQGAVANDHKVGRRLLKAVSQSLQQEFEPDLNDIRSLSKEVKDEILLAKIQADRQDQDAQKHERAAASRHRMSLARFMPKVERGLDKISESQIQQSARRSRLSSHRHPKQ
jgi:Skp family chaperone for outer membrane proteins